MGRQGSLVRGKFAFASGMPKVSLSFIFLFLYAICLNYQFLEDRRSCTYSVPFFNLINLYCYGSKFVTQTGCFVNVLPTGQNIVLVKSYTMFGFFRVYRPTREFSTYIHEAVETTRTNINPRTLQAAVIV